MMNDNQKIKFNIILESNIYTKMFKFKKNKYRIPKEVYRTCKMFFILNIILLPLLTLFSTYNVLEGNINSIGIIVLIYFCYVIIYVILHYLMLPNNLMERIHGEN